MFARGGDASGADRHRGRTVIGIGSVSEYKWSSYSDYLTLQGITDTSFFIKMLGEKYKSKYIQFMSELNDNICMETNDKCKLTDEKAREHIIKIGNIANISDIQRMQKLEEMKY